MNWYIAGFLMALAISYLATPWVRKLALRLNIMAHPGGRRVHSQPMPLWGGIAIYAAFVVTCLIIARFAGHSAGNTTLMIGVVVSSAFIVIIGLVDDMKELSAGTQSLAIICAAIILMTFGIRIQFLSNPFGHSPIIHLPIIVSWILTLVWVFALTKMVDFMDGLDGLAAGIGAIAAGVLAIMAYYAGQIPVALMAATLSGACIGFLRFNFNPAKIFMGTGGSQFIGFTLATISIIGAFKVAAAMAIALPILVFGVPIFDGIFVIIKRFRDRRPLYVADRSHLHHRLLDRGLSHKQTVLVIYTICLFLGGTAVFALIWMIKR